MSSDSSGVDFFGRGASSERAAGGRGHEGWRATLVRASLESLVEELRERDGLAGQEALGAAAASGLRGAAALPRSSLAKPSKKRSTVEQWALVAASDTDLVAGIKAHQRALYGDDSRVEQLFAPAEVRALSGSVAALFSRRDLVEVGGRFHVMTKPLGAVLALAPGEAFAEQPCGALGTAWVLDDHHMVTAGHCVPPGGADELVCVFGFAVGLQGDVPASFGAEQVAFPSAALTSHDLDEDEGGDWAILRFEQALEPPPLRLRVGGVGVGEAVWTLGHPCGLPLKYAPGAVVTRHKNADRFLATLDELAGSPGAPVFDAQPRVVGMLARGAEEWLERRDGCLVAALYASELPSRPGPLGEEVLKLSHFIARRPAAAPARQEPEPTLALGTMDLPVEALEVDAPPRRRRVGTTERLAAPLDAYALIIQISAYPGMPSPAVRDADDVAELLRDPSFGHYPPQQVTVLREEEATRAAIVAALRTLVACAGESSTVLFYFSGHAGQRGETAYLLPFDCDPRALAKTALTTRELREELSGLASEQALLIFDCCHAAGAQAGEDSDGGCQVILPGLPEAAAEELVRDRGWALVTSARPGQRSAVPRGARNSVFGRHLLEGLRGGLPSDDGYVRVLELFEYLQPRVSCEEPAQRPVLKGAPSESFLVARHRGGEAGDVARTDDGFLYHALLCFAESDAAWVRGQLSPRLLAAGLRVATTAEAALPGVARVAGIERGLAQARRTLVVVSQAFLHPARSPHQADVAAEREWFALQRKEEELRKGRYSVVPIYVEDRDLLRGVPAWLSNLSEVPLAEAANSHQHASAELERLIAELRRPLPRR